MIDPYDYIAVRDGPERAIGYVERAMSVRPIVAAIFRRFRSAGPGATICARDYGFSASNAAP
ncbi:MAG: hypothetical protein ABSB15_18515 [Bryobacteraceae bacterium]